MKLIAITGLNCTEWMVVDGSVSDPVLTGRLNPYLLSRKEISRAIRLGLPKSYFKGKFENVYFYGEGCYTQEKKDLIFASLMAQFKTNIMVSDIMLGVARGLFQNESGIACVLGQSSGSCLYNGIDIVRDIKSGGFAMGDEGGACCIGRHFLADFLKDLTSQKMVDLFLDKYQLDKDQIIERVYCQPQPQLLFCDIAMFLSKHTDDEYVNQMVANSFRSFMRRSPCQLGILEHPLRFVGVIAVAYKDLLLQVLREFGVENCMIFESPIQGLAAYHQKNG